VRTFSSPLVRKIAQEEGVDLAEVEGTGVHGRVTKQDILGHLEQRKAGQGEAGGPPPRRSPAAAPGCGRPGRRERQASGRLADAR
jgi:pyruvate dehydrogenase E2 component (dihydrolipoamide acetyltransferase)